MIQTLFENPSIPGAYVEAPTPSVVSPGHGGAPPPAGCGSWRGPGPESRRITPGPWSRDLLLARPEGAQTAGQGSQACTLSLPGPSEHSRVPRAPGLSCVLCCSQTSRTCPSPCHVILCTCDAHRPHLCLTRFSPAPKPTSALRPP